ncbi:hypothetical protein GCG54_00010971 [Colletotrichum gloeosporioides]|uniref:DNA endonuclease activator Ctp1 C-terminal domain-containing protein n=1 Tax=Colletotrichum gloeosporioides TaxID=474922 RepID=A0A8H4CRG8_COLGL|nr:uncharacterized protein GCG54_00010971 [Colletotrichum gloeosporioides]KAF3808780.1 hypothetical protein GCG54_00010971 [Colletotrichum gloeosporioides]
MDNFSPESRAAVQEAFNALRGSIGKALDTELEKRKQRDLERNESLREELDILRSRSEYIDRLEQDNSSLRNKLLRFHHQNRDTESPRSTPRPNVSVQDKATNTDPTPVESSDKENDVERVLHESHKVLRRYNALNKNFKLLKAEYQKQKDLIKQWGEYSTSLEAKIKRIEDRHGQSIDPTPAFESASEPSRPRAAATPSFTADSGAEPDQANGAVEPQLAAQPDPPADPPRDEGNLPSGHTSDRETTESGKDADEQTLPPLRQDFNVTTEVLVKSEPSSDGPIFVSERSVGKRKRADDQVTDQTTRTRIKIESSGLSNSLPSTQIQESMDLDELGPRVTTPRRKRYADLDRDKSFNSVTVRPDNVSTPAAKPLQNSAVLTPVNPNVMPVHPQEKKAVENPTRKGLTQGIRSLAEDGITYKKTGREEPAGGNFRTPQPAGRLSTLLNTAPSEETPTITRSAPRLRGNDPEDDDSLRFPDRRQLPFNKERRDKPKGSAFSRKSTEDAAEPSPTRGSSKNRATVETPLTSSKTGLRSKPVADLRMSDFKVNPKFNGGADYAYSEVVRGNDRSCLPGCTDMNCCGPHFRAMALAQKNSADRTTASDNKLFEDFLGDRISTVWGMSKPEKENLWVEAKTWQLANELGKHRHRYARRASPEGFWNVDFPNTQEVQAEKAEFEKREKQMIQERYREAMRGGGRWVFKDE